MKILLIGTDRYLWQSLKLMLGGEDVELADTYIDGYDRIIYDLDSASSAIPRAAITVSRRLLADLNAPFSYEELITLIHARGECRLKVKESEGAAILDGKKIQLTELEMKLLLALIKKGGFVGRGELLTSVFGEGKSAGLLTLYIHYLREKLEGGGEKIILSSRSEGYGISEKFIGGSGDAQNN